MSKQALVDWRHAPDRWLHEQRHRRAIARIPLLVAGDRVLVVCHGNVCRSPYAAAVLHRALHDYGILVDSAGFVWPGRPVPVHAQVTGLEHGVKLTGHRSQEINETLLREAKLVLVMDVGQRRLLRRRDVAQAPELLGDFDPQPIEKRAIRDPWGQSLPVFADVFARIDRCSAVLVQGIRDVASRAANKGEYTSA